MVTATVCLASPEIRRISIGSSVARESGRTRARPSSTTRTLTFVLLPRRAFLVLGFSSIRAPLVTCCTHKQVYQRVVRLMGLPDAARYPEATVPQEDAPARALRRPRP